VILQEALGAIPLELIHGDFVKIFRLNKMNSLVDELTQSLEEIEE
jgi:hypothetical protein